MTRWRQLYWMAEDACSLKIGGSGFIEKVTVWDMQSAFMILAMGKITHLPKSFYWRFDESE